MDYSKEEYLSYIEKKSPDSKLWKDVLYAFLVLLSPYFQDLFRKDSYNF